MLRSGTITLLFTDIEDSTMLWEQQPEAMKFALAQHDMLLRQMIDGHNGYVFKTVGDAFCAVFANATDAMDAAIAAQRGLQAPLANLPIRVRMALHTGAVEERDGDYFGPALNRVARLLSAGHGGQVLLSRASQELVWDRLAAGVTLRDMGEHRLKDLLLPEQIYQLVVPGLPTDFPPLKTLDVLQHNLPVQLTSFVGRQKELTRLKTLLATNQPGRNRLVTLTGSGGIGKTRLSIQAAQELLPEFRNGVWLVELASLTDPALVPQAVATVLDVREEQSRPLLARLTDYLREKTLLLVLDNCEHVIESCAQLADYLLRHCPDLSILASSREALGIEGENTFHVPSLSLPSTEKASPSISADFEAIQLFVERASTVLPGFALTDANAPAVVQVCRQLDGVALAIELAAARVKTLRVEQIASRLDDAFRLLTGGSRTALPRQQTLRATIDWSYNLLSDSERILLRRLSVFAGGWTLEAAESVCLGEGLDTHEVLDLLTQLVSKSLVVAERQPGQETRYHLLETTRQYAQEKLLVSGEGETVRDRHLAFYLRLAEEIDLKRKTAERLTCMKQFDTENDNFRAALKWALTESKEANAEQGLWLASALKQFWHRRGYYHEGRGWLEQGLALSAGSNHESTIIRAKALYAAGYLAFFQNDDSSAHSLFEKSIALYRKINPSDKQDFTDALNLLAAFWANNDPIAARALSEESVAICRGLGPSNKWVLAQALFWNGTIAYLQEDDATAQLCAEESQLLFRQTGDVWEAAAPISTLGHLAVRRGDFSAARTFYEESLRLWTEGDDRWAIALCTDLLGDIDRILGDYTAAISRFEESLRFWRDMGNRADMALSLRNLGIAKLFEGDHEHAATLLVESLPLLRETWDEFAVALNLAGLSGVAEAQGQGVRAARLLGAADAIDVGTTVFWGVTAVADRTEYDRLVAAGRTQMQEGAFAAAWAEGRAMMLEQAVAYALANDRSS